MRDHIIRQSLTKTAIQSLKVGQQLSDAGTGLRVMRNKGGVKFLLRKTVRGEPKQATLGYFPEMSLPDARAIVGDIEVYLREDGVTWDDAVKRSLAAYAGKEDEVSPVAVERKVKAPRKTKKGNVSLDIDAAIDLYYKKYLLVHRKKKGADEAHRILMRCVGDYVGKIPANQLKRSDVLKIAQIQLDKNNPVQCGSMLSELSACLEVVAAKPQYEKFFDDDWLNPADQAKKRLKLSKQKLTPSKVKRYFERHELPVFYKWVLNTPYLSQNHRKIYKLTLRIGCRTGELCNAEWRDFDLDNGLWILGKNKTDTPRTIILPKQALRILKADRESFPANRYLCQSLRKVQPIRQKTLTEALYTIKMDEKKSMPEIDPWTPHDLRRTTRTWLSKIKCPSTIAELAVGHTRGGIEGIYDLHEFEDEIGEWLQKWNDHLDKLIKI